jgi:hypothetical protein
MSLNPVTQIAPVFVEKVVSTITGSALQDHVFVDGPILVTSQSVLKKAEVPAGIPRMAHPLAIEDETSVQVITLVSQAIMFDNFPNLLPQGGTHTFVRIEDQHPFVSKRKMVQGPIFEIADSSNVTFSHWGSILSRDLNGAILTPPVHDKDLPCPQLYASEAILDVQDLVPSGDEHGNWDAIIHGALPSRCAILLLKSA